MREWLSAREIAEEKLPDMPGTKKGVLDIAAREGWDAAPHACRERQARGGGLEYHIRLLPLAAQMAYLQRHVRVETSAPSEDPSAPPVSPEGLAGTPATEAARLARDARLAIVRAFAQFERGSRLNRTATLDMFTSKYRFGSLAIEPWIREAVPAFSTRTLVRWLDEAKRGRTERLAVDKGRARRGTGVLDTANGGKVRAFMLAAISQNIHLSADHVRMLVRDEFGDRLTILKHGVETTIATPPVRTFQHALKALKAEHQVLLAKMTNPDRYRSTMAPAGTGTLRHIRHANDLWQIDASPADVLCTDGRHSVYVCLDIATRRMTILVSRTPRASAVGLLIRKAILAWGAPHTIKTDNGSDFTARETQRLFAALGIETELSDAYSPQQKGHVERAIRTFQHDMATLAPGFTGHNVAQRKAIEDRQSFAERLAADSAQAFGVELTGLQLQELADRWVATRYEHRAHDGLKGRTPAQAALADAGARRTIDPRALDILLMPVAGKDGRRRATKFGVRVDHYHYLSADILPGTDVFVRHDPADIGRVHCWTADRGEYVGEAVCAELAGIHPETFMDVVREERAAIIAAHKAPLEEALKGFRNGPHFLERVLRTADRDVPNVVALPRPTVEHTTPEIEGALGMLAPPLTSKPVAGPDPASDGTAISPVRPSAEIVTLVRPETAGDRYRRARLIEERLARGEDVPIADRRWWGGYRNSAEFSASVTMAEEFGDSAVG